MVVATGATSVPNVPDQLAAQVPAGITTLTTADYRNPGQLPDGGVLVVGGSASGVQIAEELQRSGRPVTLAVGEHVRMPRTYRGRDILWWMDASGLLDERYDAVPDLVRARNLPSMQLVGSPQRTVDLNALRRLGVRLVGRLAGIRDGTAQFSGSLAQRVRAGGPQAGPAAGHHRRVGGPDRGRRGAPPQRFAPTEVPAPVPLSARLGGEIATIVWATGYRHELPWLDVPVFDRKGRVAPRRRGHVQPRPVPDRPAVPAPPQVHADRRRRGGRPRADRPPGRLPGHARPPAAGRAAGELRSRACSTIPSPPALAAAVARRDPQRLSAALTETVRLRALLPGGPVESQGREDVVGRFRGWFADFDAVEVVESAGRGGRGPAADPLPPRRAPGEQSAGSAPRPRSARSSTAAWR